MPAETQPAHRLVGITIVVLVVLSVLVVYFSQKQVADPISLNTKGQPTIGSPTAKVHLVAFEEPKCVNCKIFEEQVFPKIKQEFIDTNLVSYTVIPVSFLPRSMPAAVALLCVYHANSQGPDSQLFFSYLDYLYLHQPDEHVDWTTTERLLQFAQQVLPAIEIPSLKQCILKKTYQGQIEQNTAYGRKVMGGVLATPTLFVNGKEVKNLSFEEIKKLINEALGT